MGGAWERRGIGVGRRWRVGSRPTSPAHVPLTPLLAPRQPYSPALSVPSPDAPDRIKGEVMVREVVVRGQVTTTSP